MEDSSYNRPCKFNKKSRHTFLFFEIGPAVDMVMLSSRAIAAEFSSHFNGLQIFRALNCWLQITCAPVTFCDCLLKFGATRERPIITMPPKIDPNEIKIIYLRATGGEVGSSSSLAPKIGPLGLSPKKVGEDIAKVSSSFGRAFADVFTGYRRLEGSPSDSATHYSKPTSSSIRRPICLLPSYSSIEGASPRSKEGEKHQTQWKYPI
jgi:Ribosomal protein L11, N-terminal domain